MRMSKMSIKVAGLVAGLIGFGVAAEASKQAAEPKSEVAQPKEEGSGIVAMAMAAEEGAPAPKLSREAVEGRKQVQREKKRKALEAGEAGKAKMKAAMKARRSSEASRTSASVDQNRKAADEEKAAKGKAGSKK